MANSWDFQPGGQFYKAPAPAATATTTQEGNQDQSSSNGRQRTGINGGQPGQAPGPLVPWDNPNMGMSQWDWQVQQAAQQAAQPHNMYNNPLTALGYAARDFWGNVPAMNAYAQQNWQQQQNSLAQTAQGLGVAVPFAGAPIIGLQPNNMSSSVQGVNTGLQPNNLSSSVPAPNVTGGYQQYTAPIGSVQGGGNLPAQSNIANPQGGFGGTANVVQPNPNPGPGANSVTPAAGILGTPSWKAPNQNGILGNQGDQLIYKPGGYDASEIPTNPDESNPRASGKGYTDANGNQQISGYYSQWVTQADGTTKQKWFPIGAYPDLNTKGWWEKQNGAWVWQGGMRGVANPVQSWNSSGYGSGGYGGYGGYGSSGYGSSYGSSKWYQALLNWRI